MARPQVYSTSRGGIILMAESPADALGPDGIRVNEKFANR